MDMKIRKRKDVPWLCTCRVALALVSGVGFVNLYSLRVNMSVAMVCMINQTAVSTDSGYRDQNFTLGSNKCSGSYIEENVNGTTVDNPAKEGEFTWSKSIQGFTLGAFFWGYMITQIPGGWLSNKFGGKRVFGWFMLVCAICTLGMPVAARIHPGFLIALRILAGSCQGVVWPATHGMWSYWAPPLERSKLIGFTFAGAHMGTVITFPIAGLLCEYGFDGGWSSIFYVCGIAGIVWFIFWMVLAYDTPAQHPRISESERNYIQDSLVGQTTKNVDKKINIPWMCFIKSKPFIAIMVTHICCAWLIYSFLTNVPTYMREVLQFDIKKNGLVSSIPFIGLWAMTVISATATDVFREKKIFSTTIVRKLNTAAGMLIPAVLCIILGYLDCTQWILALVLLSLAISLIGCNYGAGFIVNHADIAPQYSSILFGISNTFACIPGFVAPYVIAVLTVDQTQQQWRSVFFLSAGIAAFGAIVYILFASGEQQEWAQITTDKCVNSDVAIPLNDNFKVETTTAKKANNDFY